MVSIDDLLHPVTPSRPCGSNLEYTEAYLTLEKATAGIPARQDLATGTETPSEPPHWPSVYAQASDLLRNTKDLRVALHYIEAAVRLEGPSGLAHGLRFLYALLERYWDDLYPALDVEENDNPVERLNALAGLCDPDGIIEAVRDMPLVQAGMLGSYCLRDVDLATGRITATNQEDFASLAAIEAAFHCCDIASLQSDESALEDSQASLKAIGALLHTLSPGQGDPDLSVIQQELMNCQRLLSSWTQRRGAVVELVDSNGDVRDTKRVAPNDIRSREDIVLLLDRICDFLMRTEPSNPVPLLLARAKSLMSKNFREIIQDLAPDMLPQIDQIGGPNNRGF